MAETIKLSFDPKQLLASLNQINEATKKLAQDIDTALGQDAKNATKKFEEETQASGKRVKSSYSELAQHIKNSLKTAFDATGIMAGTKIFNEIGTGVKQVFEMERAFDRLNTRLMLTGRTYENFKNTIGNNVAARGAKLEDILPGVESASARGNIRDPKQLAQISDVLAQANRINPNENSAALSDSIVDILKQQGKSVNAANFGSTADAIEGTRVSGNFRTAGEAATAMSNLAGYSKAFNLDTRTLGGLSAVGSNAGPGGNELLKSLFQGAAVPGQEKAINDILGQNVFSTNKNGTKNFNREAFGRVNTNRLGEYSKSIIAQQTGLGDVTGTELSRVVNEFKKGLGAFDQVAHGANETASQFDTATHSLASKYDQFKASVIEGGRQIAGGLSTAANGILTGHFKEAAGGLGDSLSGFGGHAGALLGAGAITVGAGVLMGGGLNRIMKRSGAMGGLAGGLLGGQAAQAAGIQQVYVVNAAEINGGSALGGLSGAGGVLGKAGKYLGYAGAAGAAGSMAYEGTSALMNTGIGNSVSDFTSDLISRLFLPDDKSLMQQGADEAQASIQAARIAQAVKEGAESAQLKLVGPLTNASSVQPKAAGM